MSVSFDNIKLLTSYKNCEGKISFSIFKSKSRSWVPFFVYLPPNWDYSKEYPLVLFMHGMGGDETTFNKYVDAQQLNSWILEGKIEPLVIAGVRGDNNRDNVQWHTKENQELLLGDSSGEFVGFCQQNFRAGVKFNSISLEGHSRGAGGAIHYYLKKPGMFASVVAMGYVSDYTLAENCLLAKENLTDLRKEAKVLRLEIGTEDSFVQTKNRKCIFDLHEYLNKIELDHEFEVLHGVEHGFDTFWNYCTDNGIINGLSHLKFHEKARKNPK
ncbi:alpha/beta hydrolase [Marinifilum sp. RC60d5]|uniref:alpha/beta hydrolase n=1 Tax=Marinifilum sp. RC60d5 TaxID=3458414 RepID=UPI004035148F